LGSNTNINANKEDIPPGNRYFIDTEIPCSDPRGKKVSVLVDNVNSSLLANPQKQGLVYSMLSSLSKINPTSTIDPSRCVPVSVYINGSNSGDIVSRLVSSSDYSAIDPKAIAPLDLVSTTSATTLSTSTTTPSKSATTPSTSATPSTTATPSTSATSFQRITYTKPSTRTTSSNPIVSTDTSQSGFCSSTSCNTAVFHPISDRIVQFYLIGLVILLGYTVYRASIRK
jgi:hypothetical protein